MNPRNARTAPLQSTQCILSSSLEKRRQKKKNAPSECNRAHQGMSKRRNIPWGEKPDSIPPGAEIATAPARVEYTRELEEANEDKPGGVEGCEGFPGATEDYGSCLGACEATGVAWIRRRRDCQSLSKHAGEESKGGKPRCLKP